jgi:hypothetical protein
VHHSLVHLHISMLKTELPSTTTVRVRVEVTRFMMIPNTIFKIQAIYPC